MSTTSASHLCYHSLVKHCVSHSCFPAVRLKDPSGRTCCVVIATACSTSMKQTSCLLLAQGWFLSALLLMFRFVCLFVYFKTQ